MSEEDFSLSFGFVRNDKVQFVFLIIQIKPMPYNTSEKIIAKKLNPKMRLRRSVSCVMIIHPKAGPARIFAKRGSVTGKSSMEIIPKIAIINKYRNTKKFMYNYYTKLSAFSHQLSDRYA